MTDFSKVKFNCSTLGFLMTGAKTKKIIDIEAPPIPEEEPLSETAKGTLINLYGNYKFKKWQLPSGIGHQYTEHGKVCEEKAIQLVNQLDGTNFTKSIIVVSNNYMTGTPDILERDTYEVVIRVRDVKSSWNMRTYLQHLKTGVTNLYWWQAQGYMYVTQTQKAEISFCLVSPPQDLLDARIQKILSEKEGSSQDFLEYIYDLDGIPAIERRMRFIVDRDEDAIAKIPPKIERCRKYLAEIEALHESYR